MVLYLKSQNRIYIEFFAVHSDCVFLWQAEHEMTVSEKIELNFNILQNKQTNPPFFNMREQKEPLKKNIIGKLTS